MIYVILGPTGVGKTNLSIKLAKQLNADIISCDSMQIYKELNIGTAKITEKDMDGIVHHLINIRSVMEDYSVYDYQKDGRTIINKLLRDGRNIVIVGGTGLYLKALLYDYNFNSKENKNQKIYDFTLLGLTRDREKLYNIIDSRVDDMINNGLLEEVESLYNKNIRTRAVLTAIGYKELYDYLDKNISLESAINKIKQGSRNYAKRQYTFFNNQFTDIKWFNVDEVTIDEIMNNIKK